MIKQNGGNVAAKVTDACSHLITTQKDFTAQSSKGDRLTLIRLDMCLEVFVDLKPDVLLYPRSDHY